MTGAPLDGPLDPVIYDTSHPVESWWAASAPPGEHRAALTRDMAADVAVIGAGYTGLTCARLLAEQGFGTVVLDAGEIGWGASGRNGGIVGYGGSRLSATALARRFGAEQTRRAERLQTETIRALRSFAHDAGLEHHITGHAECIYAHSRKAAKALLDQVPAEGAIHTDLPPSGREDLARHGGIAISPGFGVHPLRLVRAMAAAAEEAGARICPRTRVTAWERAGPGHRLIADGGAITASRVVLATNAFTPDRLSQRFAARIVPVLSNIAVTRPLRSEELAQHPWLGPSPVADTRNLLSYMRLLPDRRLMFGMRGDLRGTEDGAVRMKETVARRIAQALPGCAEAKITHFWRGPICFTATGRPSIGLLADMPSVAHGFGWHGSGIVMGTVAGTLLAGLIGGAPETSVPAPWRGLPPKIPLPGLRPLYVGAARLSLGLADALG